MRRCSRNGCSARPTATLTYVYADSCAVVGPLALEDEPFSHDLCRRHSENMSAPRGWEIIRLPSDESGSAHAADDDLLALADAIREVGNRVDEPQSGDDLPSSVVVLAEKRHLRVIADR